MGYAVIVASIIGYLVCVHSLKMTSSRYDTIFFPLVPLVMALLAWARFGSDPLPTDLIGRGLIVLGLVLVVRGKARERKVRDRHVRAEEEKEGTELASVVMQDASTYTEEDQFLERSSGKDDRDRDAMVPISSEQRSTNTAP